MDEAAACCRRAIELKPDFAEAHNNLGAVLKDQGRLDEAVACRRKAIELKPDFAEAYNNLGTVLKEQGHLEEAVACRRKAIALKPDFAKAYSNLGNTLREQEQLGEAIACHRKAIELKPDFPEAHSNLGSVLQAQGHLEEAIACDRRAIALRQDFPDAHQNLAMALLTCGAMTEGWEEYEWRWKTPQMVGRGRRFTQPQWHGEAADGRTLLIHAEQGFGDTLQFCRYATLAAGRGMRVIIEVQKPLVRLLGCLPGIDKVVARGDELPPFDLHCPMLSLPLALRTTLATIPATASYLHAGAVEVAAWRTRLAAMPSHLPRIGLVWAGSAIHKANHRRSIALARLEPLLAVPGLHFFSLQKGVQAPVGAFPLTELMDETEDFADTAALIANLDLVIAVDTAVAHLAAAIGKPVWMLDRFDPDWRWFGGRRDSPWYPTLRIYRQPEPGGWDPVLAEIASDLRRFASTCSPASQFHPDAIEHYRHGRLGEAGTSFRMAVERTPDDPEACCNLGAALGQQGQLAEAVGLLRKAIRLRPDYPEAHSNLGIALKEQGHLDDAVASCRRAIELKPGFPDAHLNLNIALQAQYRGSTLHP